MKPTLDRLDSGVSFLEWNRRSLAPVAKTRQLNRIGALSFRLWCSSIWLFLPPGILISASRPYPQVHVLVGDKDRAVAVQGQIRRVLKSSEDVSLGSNKLKIGCLP